MKRYRVQIFFTTFVPCVVDARSEWEALKKARSVIASRGYTETEARAFTQHLERLSNLDIAELADSDF